MSCLTVCTHRSVWPCDLGYFGLQVMTSSPQFVANGRMAKLLNGLLSAISVSGMPCREKMSHNVKYPSIHGTSPSYLQSCFTRVSDMTSRRRLRSSTSHRLEVPPVRSSTVGTRAFPVSGTIVWNELPLHVASAPSLAVFRPRLKTFLFPIPTKTLSYDSCVTITIHHYYLDTCGSRII